VAHHKSGAPALGRFNHPVCFFEVARDGLFYKDVYARFQKAARYLSVRLGWRGKADCVNAAYERLPVTCPVGLPLGGDSARRLLNSVADGYELALSFVRERGVYARVLSAEVAHANDGCS
jgi:hypothetical protein